MSDNLNDLIASAAKQASRQQKPAVVTRTPSAVPKMVILGALVLGGIYALWSVASALRPPGDAGVQRDLENVVEQARQSVESARAANGRLPGTLPNASLAAVVGYEPAQDGYKLVATLMGVRVTLQSDGKKSIDKSAP